MPKTTWYRHYPSSGESAGYEYMAPHPLNGKSPLTVTGSRLWEQLPQKLHREFKAISVKNTWGRGKISNISKENNTITGIYLKNGTADSINWQMIPIKKVGQRMILLGDLATVKYREQQPSSYFRINGLNTINLVIYPEESVNNLKLAKSVKETVAELTSRLPAGYSLILASDSTEYIRGELDKILIRTVLSLAILLTFVLFNQPADEIPAFDHHQYPQ